MGNQNESNYDANQIQILEGLQAVRKKTRVCISVVPRQEDFIILYTKS